MEYAPLSQPLLTEAGPAHLRPKGWVVGAVGSLLLLAGLACWSPPSLALRGLTLSKRDDASSYMFGTSLGGWLVMEINPSKKPIGSSDDLRPQWMYDQIEAYAELDFVMQLRKTSDDFAVQTMKNHWEGYLPDAVLDAAVRSPSHARNLSIYWHVWAM